jgi:hypothetical protein
VGLTLRLLQFCYQLPKTSELGRATNAHITVIVYFRDHYRWFRVCSFAELSFAFIIPPPRMLQLSTPTFPSSFFPELHHTSMGHTHLVCTQLYIVTHLVEGQTLQVPCFSKGLLYTVPFLLSLTTPFSVKETLIDFSYTYAPNLIHQGASVITEISSTQGDKNSASSKQDWSHSWHRINSTTLQKGQKTIQNDQKFEKRFTSSGCTRVCA